jgi:hypothetical protein
MDIAVHWGVLRYLRKDIGANPLVPGLAIALDAVALASLLVAKAASDPFILYVAAAGLAATFFGEKLFLSWKENEQEDGSSQHVS